MRPRDGPVDVTSANVAAWDGRGHVVADEGVGGGGAEACHYGRGYVTAAEDVASVEVAAQTAASDVAASLWTRPSEGGGRFWGRNYERGHGTIAEVVASVDVAGWYDHGGCRVERTRLLDGCVATAASAIVSCACKLLQGSFCSAIAWSMSLFVFVDAAGSTVDIQHLVAHQACQITLDTHVTACPLLACHSRAPYFATAKFLSRTLHPIPRKNTRYSSQVSEFEKAFWS